MTSKQNPDNPSRRATKRVKNPIAIPHKCCYCGGAVEWKNNSIIYNGVSYGSWPFIYHCGDCGSSVGLHPHTNIPLGTLANDELKRARKHAKEFFEPLWRGTLNVGFSRTEAYSKLASKMGISEAACHFGIFDLEQANKARDICADLCLQYQQLLPKSIVARASILKSV